MEYHMHKDKCISKSSSKKTKQLETGVVTEAKKAGK